MDRECEEANTTLPQGDRPRSIDTGLAVGSGLFGLLLGVVGAELFGANDVTFAQQVEASLDFDVFGRLLLLVAVVVFFVHRLIARQARPVRRVAEPLLVIAAANGYWARELGAGQTAAVLVFSLATLTYSLRLADELDGRGSLGIQSKPRLPGSRHSEWTMSPALCLLLITLAFGSLLVLSLRSPDATSARGVDHGAPSVRTDADEPALGDATHQVTAPVTASGAGADASEPKADEEIEP